MSSLSTFMKSRRTASRLRQALEQKEPIKLHIGCGPVLHPGWFNLDVSPPEGALFLDARLPLPLPDDSVHTIFHEHFLEHLTLEQGFSFLSECARVLEPNGWMRLSTPDLELIIATYLDRNPFVSRTDALIRHARLRKMSGPLTAAMLFNDKMHLWNHRFIYDRETLWHQLTDAGFQEIRVERFGESRQLELQGLERHADVAWMKVAEPLIVEARRGPRGP